jgi:putative nucleotidyltransferase-like protein
MIEPVKEFPRERLAALLVCTRTPVDGDAVKRILGVARSEADWEGLLAAANEQRQLPVFCKNLEAYAGEALPSPWRQRVREEFVRNSCRNLALTAELFRVLDALERDGVRGTLYKGPVLAAQAYGDVALRQFSDLDIMVPQRQIAAAHDALVALGFRASVPGLINGCESAQGRRQIPGQYAYRNDCGTMVELHTELTLRYFPRRLDVDELCGRREVVNVAGRQVLTFSREDTLLLTSVHGSKHIWECLGWIADIAALTNAAPQLDWGLALERAREWGVQRMVLLGAGLAAELYHVRLPTEVAGSLTRDGIARRLINGVCRRFFAAEPVQLGVFSRFAFRVRMRGSLVEGFPYAVRLALRPTELDRTRQAQYLEPVFPILRPILGALRRPLRLARTYGWRTRAGR